MHEASYWRGLRVRLAGRAALRPPPPCDGPAASSGPLFHIEDRPWPNPPRDQPISGVTGARLLVVEARYYDDIGEIAAGGRTACGEARRARIDLLTMPGALEIPAAIAIALDAAEAAGAPYDGASRWAASFAARPIISRSSRARARAR